MAVYLGVVLKRQSDALVGGAQGRSTCLEPLAAISERGCEHWDSI